MVLKLNEGTVCDAVIRYIEGREKAARTDVWRPEEKENGEVELAWKLGGAQYVIEHTGIEPFEGLIRMSAEAQNHFDPITAACAGGLPLDVFELEVPARCMQGLDRAAIRKTQAVLVDWIRETGPKLPVRRYSDYIGADGPVTVAGVHFPVRLFRFEDLAKMPRLQIKHIAPDMRKERPERIQRACDAKFPKLAEWKGRGARTILVLEDNDIQLTNPATVAETFVPIAQGRKDRPDETYMVASCMEPWQLWPILVDGKSYFDLANCGLAGNWPIDQTSLNWITSKRGK
jgi:hypothetical protein